METTNLYSISVPPIIKTLKNLSALLDKAATYAATKASERIPAEKQMDAMLNDRLIFDQFALIRQIQIVTDNAKGGAARLAQIEAPKFEDTEKTVAELKERIAKTIQFLENIKPEQIIGNEAIKITLPYFPTKYFTAFAYATEYLIPNVLFHYTTAYSIMRKNGVNVGKADFMGGLPLKNL